jgi:hypothetical protein
MILGGNAFYFEFNKTQMSIGDGSNNTIILHGYQFTFDLNKDFLIRGTNGRLFFSSGLNFKNVSDNLEISNSGSNIPTASEKITIPYGLNMGLSSTEFSVYDDDETKNITFPKGLRVVTDGNYLRAWKPGTVVGADLKDQIQINYGFRVHAANPCLIFHKPGDTIYVNLNSSNQIQMPWGLVFTSDDTYLTIYKPGDLTKGVKLAWQTL